MDIFIIFLYISFIILYINKIFLHYRLLRIQLDGERQNEDYILSFFSDHYKTLRAKVGGLSLITEDFKFPFMQKLKVKLNNRIKLIYIISFLAIILTIFRPLFITAYLR